MNDVKDSQSKPDNQGLDELELQKKVDNELKVRDIDVQNIIKLMNEDLNINETLDKQSSNQETVTNGTTDTGFDELSNNNITDGLYSNELNNCNNSQKDNDSSDFHVRNDKEDLKSFLNSNDENENDYFNDKIDIKNSETDHLTNYSNENYLEDNQNAQNVEVYDAEDEAYDDNYDENQEDEDEYAEDSDEAKNEEELQDEDLLKLNEFIEKAIEFGANALDLSKKNLKKLPRKLFQLPNIQVRNNELTELPTRGLSNHQQLRYLLLENNKITKLPFEIATLPNLTALNLADNPIEYPPLEVIQKGCKFVQEYIRESLNEDDKLSRNLLNYDATDLGEDDIRVVNDDVWASDDEDQISSKNRNSSKLRSKSASGATFDLSSLQSSNYLKDKSAIKLLNKRKTLPPPEVAIYQNEEFEKAIITGKVDKYKKNKEKIDAKLQKVKDRKITDKFKNDLKAQQRKMFGKRLVKGVDFVEPVMKAPFDINEEHMTVMTNEERAVLDKKLDAARQKSLSPETLWRLEEERRLKDNELQDKIREYTYKLLSKRNYQSENPKHDRIEAARDIKELKELEKELEQRRMELQHNFRSYHGNLLYRETAKLNAKAHISNVLKNNK